MSSLGTNRPKREDRIARQERDPGAPDDDVYSADHSVIYHERDCKRLEQVDDEKISKDTRAAEQRRWKAPCLWCIIEGDQCSP